MINLGQTSISLELREMFSNGAPLRVGTRAFDILELLIRHRGHLVTKDEILQHVWPQAVVEENNLQVHISALRKALGGDRDLIRTIPGRGYVLLAGQRHGDEANSGEPVIDAPVVLSSPQDRPDTSLGAESGTTLIGRTVVYNEVCQALSVCALVTLTGQGGVGKTALANEVGRGFSGVQSTPVYFVSLSELKGPALLMDAVASALGVDCSRADPMPQTLINRLSAEPCLIVLDNCEHLIEAVATLVEILLRSCPHLRILATSREPLRIAHERSLRVPTLPVPPPGACRQDTLRSASVQLLLQHLRALDSGFAQARDDQLDAQSVDLLGDICRRLDGLPLALQMAAARASGLGLFELAASLGESMHLLTAGLRTAPPRHHTLQASLIWSLRLLNDDELTVLERLSQLQGRFTLDLACDAVQNREISRGRVLDGIVGLALKSLLTVTAEGPFRFYCVPETTRGCLRRLLQENADHPRAQAAAPADGEGATLSVDGKTGVIGKCSPHGFSGYHASHQRMLAASR
jgi:predicted ATPase/DNA-binding winged helix-turn-helix (wHTH) protein